MVRPRPFRLFLLLSLSALLLTPPPTASAHTADQYEDLQVRQLCYRFACGFTDDQTNGLISLINNEIILPLVKVGQFSGAAATDIHFFIYGARSPNAVALMHYTGINTGMLRLVESEDELAFVLAHEFAHIEKHHYEAKARRIAGYYLLRLLVLLLGGYDPGNDPYFNLSMQILLSSFSREDEYAADARGVELMRAAGFDPAASVSLLSKLRAYEPIFGDLFADHPSIDARVGRLREIYGLP